MKRSHLRKSISVMCRCEEKTGSLSGVILSLAGSENDFLLKHESPECAAWVLAQVCFGGESH